MVRPLKPPPRLSFARDLLALLRENRKLWLVPLMLVLILIGVIVSLGGSPLAPLLYTLF